MKTILACPMKKPQYPWALLPDRATVTEGSHWTRASHKGYRKLGIAELSRLVAFCPPAIVCCDGATSTQTVDGSDDQHLVGHVHLHPDVQLTLVQIEMAQQLTNLTAKAIDAG